MSAYDNFLIKHGYDSTIKPDAPTAQLDFIAKNAVISRDRNGNVLSKFEDDSWNLKTVDPSNKAIWNFDIPNINKDIKTELKKIQYARFYYSPSSRTVSSIRMTPVHEICRWAVNNHVSIERMLTDTRLYNYIASSLSKLERRQAQDIVAVIRELASIRQINASFAIAPKNFDLADLLDDVCQTIPKKRVAQTPVIPTRLYASIIDSFYNSLQEFNTHADSIYQLYDAFKRGFSTDVNFITHLHKNGRYFDFIGKFGLIDLASKHKLNNKKSWNKYLREISEEAKYWIHLFTGMRDTEVNTLAYSCLTDIDTKGISTKIIVGYTSKTIGSGATATYWITSEIIQVGINAARNYAKITGLDLNYVLDDNDYPLFPQQQPNKNSSGECRIFKNAPFSVGFGQRQRFNDWLCKYDELVVTEADISELTLYDGFRNWDKDIKIGHLWPLSTHQCRRSLAVYLAKSGLVSLGSLQLQFKHLHSAMTSYYRKNSAFAKNFILNDEDDEYHQEQLSFIDLLDTERKIAEFLDYEDKVIPNQPNLWGGEGTRIRTAHKKGRPLIIVTDKDSTKKRFMKGEMTFKKSPLGGCTKIESCDQISITNQTSCITCKDSILDIESISHAKQALGNMIKSRDRYSTDSIHYHHLNSDIIRLESQIKSIEETFNV